MHILQIHNFYKTFGGECSVVNAEHKLLECADRQVKICSIDSNAIDQFSFLHKFMSFLQIPFNFESYLRLDSHLRLKRPYVAHVHNIFPLLSPSVYSVLKKYHLPVVQTVHNYRFLCPNGLFFINGQICEDCLHRGLFSCVKKKCMHDSWATSAMYAAAVGLAWRTGNIPNNIDIFIALNRFGRDKLIQGGVPAEKIRVCGNFIEHIADHPQAKADYVLYLGRLSSEKGLHTLFKAMQVLPPHVRLKVAGSGPLEPELKDFAARHLGGKVEFLGFVTGEEKTRLISHALCMVVPSEWYEPFGLSVIESMALGTPVVASRMGGLPEMIEHQETGLLFTAGDAEELAQQILAIYSNSALTKAMSKAAIETARVRFSKETHLRELMSIYEEAISMNK